jgi:hypothetical protein
VAIAGGHVEVAMLLVNVGADVTKRNSDSWTALHYAAYNNNTEMAKFLVDAGVKVDQQDSSGRTALHLCSDIPMAKYLIVEVRILCSSALLGYACSDLADKFVNIVYFSTGSVSLGANCLCVIPL